MRKRRIQKRVNINPNAKEFNSLNEPNKKINRKLPPVKRRIRKSVVAHNPPPPPPKSQKPKNPHPNKKYTITHALYENNENFSNSIPLKSLRKIFFNNLQTYCISKFNEAKTTGKPIVNMVFHGHWGWVFSKMIQKYKKYNNKFEIISSVYPIPGAAVYQYWRPVSDLGLEMLKNISDANHPYWSKGVHMMHDSPFDKNRAKAEVRILTLGKIKNALCTSKEQQQYFDGKIGNTKFWYTPLGINENLIPREKINLDNKIKIGFIGRLYWDKVKGEDLLIKIAEKLDPNKFEFVILSPNADKLISVLKRKFTVYTNNSGSFENLFSSIDVTLILSKYEGTPLPLIESLKLGIHVLSTRVGEVPTVLGKKYILSSADEFVKGLNEVYENRDLLQTVKEKGPEIVKDRTWKLFVEKSMKIWESIL